MSYVDTIYDPARRPYTEYPALLAEYLCDRYMLKPGQRLLDVGFGRQEMLFGFYRQRLKIFGVDREVRTHAAAFDLRVANLERGAINFHDDFFDVVFSKSTLEHFYYPERVVREMKRVLKPGGLLLTLVPDWDYCKDIYHEDYTHRTAFTMESLRDLQLIQGLEDVHVERFTQLPFLWRHTKLVPFSRLLGAITPSFLRRHSKTVKFSKEIMLLSHARKPC